MSTAACVRTRIRMLTIATQTAFSQRRERLLGDRGEGVISTAIAVLIIAFLGAGMWVAFDTIWTGAENNIRTEVESIG